MKKLLLLLTFILVFSLTACSGDDVTPFVEAIAEMELIDTDDVFEDIEMTANGEIVLYEDNYILALYGMSDRLAGIEIGFDEDNNIEYIDIHYQDNGEKMYISVTYDGPYETDMTPEKWMNFLETYTTTTIFNLLIEIEVIVPEE